MKSLILIDGTALGNFRDGQVPTVIYSHDRNLLQYAHEALRRGHDVYFVGAGSDIGEKPYVRAQRIFPTWQAMESENNHALAIDPDIIVSVAPQALNIKKTFPRSKVVAIHAAIQWLEAPELFSGQYVYDLITSLRHNVDFIVTQNSRMKEILLSLYRMLSGWRFEDRVIVAPLGLVAEERILLPPRARTRSELGLKNTDIALINSGGVWRWTDFLCFFEAFTRLSRQLGSRSRLKLLMPGVIQPANRAHDETVRKFESILRENLHLLGTSLILETDWEEASKKVGAWTQAADVGINVNTQSLESWQSHRLRFLDYLRFGLPVISSGNDLLSQRLAKGMYACETGSVEDYVRALRSINDDNGELRRKSAFMTGAAAEFSSTDIYGRCIQMIEEMPPLTIAERERQDECVLDYAHQVMTGQVLDKFKAKLLAAVY